MRHGRWSGLGGISASVAEARSQREARLVETMRKQLVALEPGLKQSAADTAKLAQQVATDQQAADAVKARVEKEEAAVAA